MAPLNKAEVLRQEQMNSAAHLVETVPRTTRIYGVGKKIIDFVGALVGIVLSSPVILILAILIKLEDPKGPVFFKQVRIGRYGNPFIIYKLRSMIVNAESLLPQLMDKNEVSGMMFKMKHDPRTTRVGRFIRKTSLDELPQLWNVLKGDMSLVGPRPPLPQEVMGYSEYHFKRLEVQPGCTGLWQISARNQVGFEEMVELDLKYIRERSLLLDIKIILKTFLVFFGRSNAY